MAQFQAFSRQVMVNGQTVLSVISGMGAFSGTAAQILQHNGIANPVPTEWYPQQAWLDAFREIAQSIGSRTLYQIGVSIPRNAKFPPGINTVEKALESLDVAYHMNHRKNGKVLFDPTTGTMEEGIGHYGYERVPATNQIISECNNPYPCSFDFGIVAAMAAKFEKNAKVVHDDTKPCRKKGADSCTYVISW